MAMNSQYPMLTLMVMYTVVSLWILAQPHSGVIADVSPPSPAGAA